MAHSLVSCWQLVMSSSRSRRAIRQHVRTFQPGAEEVPEMSAQSDRLAWSGCEMNCVVHLYKCTHTGM